MRKHLRPILFWLACLSCGFVAGCSGGCGCRSTISPAKLKLVQNSKPEITIQISNLLGEYKADEVQADEKFSGKVIVVAGKASTPFSMIGGETILDLTDITALERMNLDAMMMNIWKTTKWKSEKEKKKAWDKLTEESYVVAMATRKYVRVYCIMDIPNADSVVKKLKDGQVILVIGLCKGYKRYGEKSGIKMIGCRMVKGEAAVPELIKLLKVPKGNGRIWAAEMLGEIGPKAKAAIPELVGGLGDRDKHFGLAAQRALVRIGPEAIPMVSKAVRGKNRNARIQAANVLAKIGPKAIPALIELLKHKVREPTEAGVALALVWIGKPAVPALSKLLQDKSPIARANAASVLVGMGNNAKEAKPALTQALKDRDNKVRSIARIALRNIAGLKDRPFSPTVPSFDKEWQDLDEKCRAVRGRTFPGLISPYGRPLQKVNALVERYIAIVKFTAGNPRSTLDQVLEAAKVSANVRTAFQQGVNAIQMAEGKKTFDQKAKRARQIFARDVRDKATKNDLPFLVYALKYLNSPGPEWSLVRGEFPNPSPIEAVINRELQNKVNRDEVLGLVLVAIDRYNGSTESGILCKICAKSGDLRTLPALFRAYSPTVTTQPLVDAIRKIDPRQVWLDRYVAFVEQRYPGGFHMRVRAARQLKRMVSEVK